MESGRQRTHTKYLVREENDYFVIELPDEESPADEATFSEKGDMTPVIESKHDPYEPSCTDDEVTKASFAEEPADGGQLVTCVGDRQRRQRPCCQRRVAREPRQVRPPVFSLADSDGHVRRAAWDLVARARRVAVYVHCGPSHQRVGPAGFAAH